MTTELERTLKDCLLRLEKDISSTQARQNQTMTGQKEILEDHARKLLQLRREIALINGDLQALTERSQVLAKLYNRLEPLLTKLEGLLNAER